MAISKDDRADYTVILTAGIDNNNNLYVLEVKRKRLNPKETLDEIFSTYQKWKPIQVGIETVAYQKSLIYFAKDEMRRRNVFIPIIELKAEGQREENKGIDTKIQYRNCIPPERTHGIRGRVVKVPKGRA